MRLTILLGYWFGYFALHSLLASDRIKLRIETAWPDFTPYYRLCYNGIAIVLLLPGLWLIFMQHWPVVYRFEGIGALIAMAFKAAAATGFLVSLRYYDLQEFLGLRQWRKDSGQARFVVSPFHRFVRHPWYFFALVILWSSDLDLGRLWFNIAATLYFIVGSRLEERKLLACYGNRYANYMKRVPGLVPLPWKFLRRGEPPAA